LDELSLIQKLAVMLLPLVLAVTVHEAAHGWVADKLGDPTARELGRITFNPLPHIDPIGTVLLPMLMLAFTGFMFGWAKPVPVDFRRLRHPRRDMAVVALAGPMANLLMAIVWSLLLVLAHSLVHSAQWFALPLLGMAVAGVFLNLILMALNLLPIPPLDGGRIMAGILPMNLARIYARIEPFGFFIVIFLLISGILGLILGPVVFGLVYLLPGSDLVLGILPSLMP